MHRSKKVSERHRAEKNCSFNFPANLHEINLSVEDTHTLLPSFYSFQNLFQEVEASFLIWFILVPQNLRWGTIEGNRQHKTAPPREEEENISRWDPPRLRLLAPLTRFTSPRSRYWMFKWLKARIQDSHGGCFDHNSLKIVTFRTVMFSCPLSWLDLRMLSEMTQSSMDGWMDSERGAEQKQAQAAMAEMEGWGL